MVRKISLRMGIAGIGLATTATLGLGALTAGSAHAQDTAGSAHAQGGVSVKGSVPGHFTASGVNIRTGPSTSRTSLGQGQNGQAMMVNCWQRDGNWWNITAGNLTGWVYWPDNVLVDSGVGEPPFC